MKTISIQREIETDGAYGCRQIIVEINASFEHGLEHTTDNHPVVPYTEMTELEILDDCGHDITETISPNNLKWLEKQAWDAI